MKIMTTICPRFGVSVLLLLFSAFDCVHAQSVYQDSFSSGDGALNGRTTASGYGSWANADGAFQVGSGQVRINSNTPYDWHSATFALPTMTSSDTLSLAITVRPSGQHFVGFGFTPYQGQYVANSGFGWLYYQGLGASYPNIQIFTGGSSGGSTGHVYLAGLENPNVNFDASLPTTFQYTYSAPAQTLSISAINGSSTSTLLDKLNVSSIPLSGFSNFALQFQGQTLSGDANAAYVDSLSVAVTPPIYWAAGATGGGSGTWSAGQNNWASASATQGSSAQSSTGTLLFGGAAGTVTVSGGVSAVAGLAFSTSGYTLAGSSISLDGSDAAANTITTASSVNTTIASQLTGANGMSKAGNGTLTLAGSNNYSGTTAINAGTLTIADGNALGSTAQGTTVANGAQLRLNAVGAGFVVGNENLTISGQGVTTGGALRNAAGNNTLQGKVTLAANATIGAAGSTSLTLDVASGNAIEASNFNLTFDGAGTTVVNDGISLGTGAVTKIGTGRTILGAANSYSGATTVNAGVLQVASGGSIASSSTSVNNGGTLDVAGTAGGVAVNSGGTLKGSGTIGALSIASGGKLAPGNSTGILNTGSTTFLGGGNYDWEIDTFGGGVVGTNWDFLNITGDLTISANSGSQFIIDVISLLATTDTAGSASNFNDGSNYSFAIATASGSINGYAADAFRIDTSAFRNSFTGTWGTGLSNDGKSLNVIYTAATAIPEPGSASLLLIGLGYLVLRRRS